MPIRIVLQSKLKEWHFEYPIPLHPTLPTASTASLARRPINKEQAQCLLLVVAPSMVRVRSTNSAGTRRTYAGAHALERSVGSHSLFARSGHSGRLPESRSGT